MNSLIKVVLLVFGAAVSSRIYVLWNSMQFGKEVYNHTPGPCRTIDGVEHGSEDIQVTSNGKAFITSGMKNYLDISDPTFQDRNGKIFLFDFTKPNNPIQTLKIKGDIDLSNWGPHGISIWEDKNGLVILFVVVHRPSGGSIEKFKYLPDSGSLQHLQTLTNVQYMRKLNDLVAVSEDSFYFTNALYYESSLELLSGVHWGNVVFFNGTNYHVATKNLQGPNGINVSPDGKFLYTPTGDNTVTVYQRRPDNTLSFLKKVAIHTRGDNIDIDPKSGALWIGCHPIMHKVMKYMYDLTSPTPSQVLRLEMNSGDVMSMTEVYSDDGAILKGSSIAVRFQEALLVGTVYDKLLYCEIKHI